MMHTTILFASALFTTLALSQSDNFNINTAEESKVVADVSAYVTSIEASPAFKTDVAALLKVVPPSVVEEAATDPESLLEELADSEKLPAWATAIPTSVLGSLETLAAKPLEALSDLEDYLEAIAEEPEVESALEALQTAVPTSVQAAIESDPVAFLEAAVTGTGLPAWVTDIPAPVQSEIGVVVNGGLSIIAADLEGVAAPTGSLPTLASGFLPSPALATGTGSPSVVGYNGTKATGTPGAQPFEGGAAGLKSVGAGMAAVIAGAGILIWA